jgi:hypothetical protein
MNPKQVNQLYKQLTPKELANLTIETINKGLPSKELELIKDSIQTGLYRLPVWEYRHHLRGYEQLSFCYGLQWWKAQALATLAGDFMNHTSIAESHYDDMVNVYRVFCGKLASIEQALVEVCNKAKFDIEAVKWLAEMDSSSNAFRPLPPNTEPTQLDHYRYMFHVAALLDYPESTTNHINKP